MRSLEWFKVCKTRSCEAKDIAADFMLLFNCSFEPFLSEFQSIDISLHQSLPLLQGLDIALD